MITYFALWILIACILTLSVVDHGVDPWFGQIKEGGVVVVTVW
jgi:hypothetical protein